MGQEAIAVLLQSRAQLAIVVDLAIADQHQRAIGVVQRLLAAVQIDDGQAAMAERGERIVMHALAVRPAMRQRVEHSLQRLLATAGRR